MPLRARAALVLAILSVPAAAAAAQQFERPLATLVVGPERRVSLPFGVPNRAAYDWAVYRTRAGFDVVVCYPREPVSLPVGSQATDCDGQSARVFLVETDVVYEIELSESSGTLFFVFPNTMPRVCSFVTPFLDRFRFFVGLSGVDPIAPMPAVVP